MSRDFRLKQKSVNTFWIDLISYKGLEIYKVDFRPIQKSRFAWKVWKTFSKSLRNLKPQILRFKKVLTKMQNLFLWTRSLANPSILCRIFRLFNGNQILSSFYLKDENLSIVPSILAKDTGSSVSSVKKEPFQDILKGIRLWNFVIFPELVL